MADASGTLPALIQATDVSGTSVTPSPEPDATNALQEISAEEVDNSLSKSPHRCRRENAHTKTNKEEEEVESASCVISATSNDVVFQKLEEEGDGEKLKSGDDVILFARRKERNDITENAPHISVSDGNCDVNVAATTSTQSLTETMSRIGNVTGVAVDNGTDGAFSKSVSMSSLASSTRSYADSTSDTTVGLHEVDLNTCIGLSGDTIQGVYSGRASSLTSEDESDVLLSESELTDQMGLNGFTKSTRSTVVTLKRRIAALESELDECREELNSCKTLHQKRLTELQAEWLVKNEALLNQVEAAVKAKETIVMKYASSEHQVIVAKKAKEQAEQKLHSMAKERDQYFARVKTLLNEKTRLCASLDNRLADMSRLQREFENLRSEVTHRDLTNKQLQERLDTEIAAHKETQGQVATYIAQLEERTQELERLRQSTQQMQEESAREAAESQLVRFQAQVDELRQKLNDANSESNALTRKVQSLERERLEHEESLSRLRETHRLQLEQLENECQQRVQELKELNDDLREEAENCRKKESEMLDFTEKLTERTVSLQSERNLFETRVQNLAEENVSLRSTMSKVEAKCQQLELDLEREKSLRRQETQTLAKKLAESIKHGEALALQVEEAQNESKVFKRRHLSSVKELSRELLNTKRKLEMYEASNGTPTGSEMSSTSVSRRDSIHEASADDTQPVVSFVQASSSVRAPTAQKNMDSGGVSLVDKQLLVERIVKLQKNLARKNDKIEFLEEHVRELLLEIRKKSKIIHSFVMKEEAGALTSSHSDKSKADLARRGRGIMASMYNSQPSDGALTLELSLEINRKLQAVLEDALLKNITLKESVNTLGEEIAKLTASKKELPSTS